MTKSGLTYAKGPLAASTRDSTHPDNIVFDVGVNQLGGATGGTGFVRRNRRRRHKAPAVSAILRASTTAQALRMRPAAQTHGQLTFPRGDGAERRFPHRRATRGMGQVLVASAGRVS